MLWKREVPAKDKVTFENICHLSGGEVCTCNGFNLAATRCPPPVSSVCKQGVCMHIVYAVHKQGKVVYALCARLIC